MVAADACHFLKQRSTDARPVGFKIRHINSHRQRFGKQDPDPTELQCSASGNLTGRRRSAYGEIAVLGARAAYQRPHPGARMRKASTSVELR
ncbi:unnamed protein product [Urochloa humidicola]